jgi:nitrilase
VYLRGSKGLRFPCECVSSRPGGYSDPCQGEQIHVANFPAFPFTNWYEEAEAIKIRCQAHAFEGKIFVIASTSLMDPKSLELMCKTPEKRKLLEGMNYALSAVFGPDGRIIGEPLIDEEGIVYADVCLDDLILPKLMHDITGHYNQFGVLSLTLNRTPQKPLYEQSENAQDIEILNPTINRSQG